jgi:hypothetical protein
LPSYIPAASFATAVLDLAESGLREGTGGVRGDLDRLRLAVWKVDNAAVRTILQTALNTAGDDMEQVHRFVADWYNTGMDRVSGWYKRYTDAVVFIGGFALCVVLNVNALLVGHALYEEPTLRANVAQVATQAAADSTRPQAESFSERLKRIETLGLPIGWDQHMRELIETKLDIHALRDFVTIEKWVDPKFLLGLAELLGGWTITALAMMLGAPFWFDVLNKIVRLRSALKPDQPRQPQTDNGSTAPAPKPAAAPLPPPAGGTPALTRKLDDANGADEVAAIDPCARLGIARSDAGLKEVA